MADREEEIVNPLDCGEELGIFVTSIVLFSLTFHEVQPNYVALDYDKNLERVNLDHTYGPGRHALGVNHQLVPFPTKNVQLLFCDDVCVDQESDSGPITSRSRDGLAVEIRLSLQYKVDTSRESMASLFYDYGLPEVNPNLAVQVARPTYEVLYIAVARSELRHVIAKYTAFDMVEFREEIAEDMRASLNAKLSVYHGSVPTLQLLNVGWPIAIQDAVVATMVAEQDIGKATAEYNIAATAAATTVLEAQISSKQVVLVANSTAKATVLAAASTAQMNIDRAVAEVAAWGAANDLFTNGDPEAVPPLDGVAGFDTPGLLQYIFLQSSRANTQTKFVYGYPTPVGQ